MLVLVPEGWGSWAGELGEKALGADAGAEGGPLSRPGSGAGRVVSGGYTDRPPPERRWDYKSLEKIKEEMAYERIVRGIAGPYHLRKRKTKDKKQIYKLAARTCVPAATPSADPHPRKNITDSSPAARSVCPQFCGEINRPELNGGWVPDFA